MTKMEDPYREELSTGTESVAFVKNRVETRHLPLPLFNCANNNLLLYNCKNCDNNFDTKIHLRKHIEEEHSGNEKKKDFPLRSYICRNCSFNSKSSLHWLKHVITRSHVCYKSSGIIRKRNKTKKILKCDRCDFTTKWYESMKVHKIGSHTDDKDKNCSYKSLKKNNLKADVISKHYKERFECEKQTEISTQPNKQENWFQYDNGIFKKFLRFNRRKVKKKFAKHAENQMKETNLERHVLAEQSENDITWFKCDCCEFKTRWKHIYMNHIFRIKYKCEKCRFQTNQENYFQKHIQEVHQEPKFQFSKLV